MSYVILLSSEKKCDGDCDGDCGYENDQWWLSWYVMICATKMLIIIYQNDNTHN